MSVQEAIERAEKSKPVLPGPYVVETVELDLHDFDSLGHREDIRCLPGELQDLLNTRHMEGLDLISAVAITANGGLYNITRTRGVRLIFKRRE